MDTAEHPTARLPLINDLTDLDRLTPFIEQFCEQHGVPPHDQFAWTLALEELVTNIMHYAWPQGGTHTFELTLNRLPHAIQAVLRDDGIPFDPLSRPEPDLNLPLEEREIGGLGIHFVREKMDELHYQHRDGHNELRLLKKLPAPEQET